MTTVADLGKDPQERLTESVIAVDLLKSNNVAATLRGWCAIIRECTVRDANERLSLPFLDGKKRKQFVQLLKSALTEMSEVGVCSGVPEKTAIVELIGEANKLNLLSQRDVGETCASILSHIMCNEGNEVGENQLKERCRSLLRDLLMDKGDDPRECEAKASMHMLQMGLAALPGREESLSDSLRALCARFDDKAFALKRALLSQCGVKSNLHQQRTHITAVSNMNWQPYNTVYDGIWNVLEMLFTSLHMRWDCERGQSREEIERIAVATLMNYPFYLDRTSLMKKGNELVPRVKLSSFLSLVWKKLALRLCEKNSLCLEGCVSFAEFVFTNWPNEFASGIADNFELFQTILDGYIYCINKHYFEIGPINRKRNDLILRCESILTIAASKYPPLLHDLHAIALKQLVTEKSSALLDKALFPILLKIFSISNTSGQQSNIEPYLLPSLFNFSWSPLCQSNCLTKLGALNVELASFLESRCRRGFGVVLDEESLELCEVFGNLMNTVSSLIEEYGGECIAGAWCAFAPYRKYLECIMWLTWLGKQEDIGSVGDEILKLLVFLYDPVSFVLLVGDEAIWRNWLQRLKNCINKFSKCYEAKEIDIVSLELRCLCTEAFRPDHHDQGIIFASFLSFWHSYRICTRLYSQDTFDIWKYNCLGMVWNLVYQAKAVNLSEVEFHDKTAILCNLTLVLFDFLDFFEDHAESCYFLIQLCYYTICFVMKSKNRLGFPGDTVITCSRELNLTSAPNDLVGAIENRLDVEKVDIKMKMENASVLEEFKVAFSERTRM
eukprot:Nk52_evm102s485 gene=Nk52_evmTU102s485